MFHFIPLAESWLLAVRIAAARTTSSCGVADGRFLGGD